jgi:hypothetical protein
MPGRPKIEISLEQLLQYAQFNPTNRELAGHFGCSERTIDARLKTAAYRDALEKGKAQGDFALRKKQHLLAMAGDRTMLIWLGKNRLGQRDKLGISAPDGGPIQVAVKVHPDLSRLSAEDLDELERLTRKALDA